LRIQICKFTMA